MIVVIFRATVSQLNEEYYEMARHLRELALSQYNCHEFKAVSDGTEEIALSYWESEDDIKAWKNNADHIIAQQLGRSEWYESYIVEIAEIKRSYRA